MTTLNEYGLQKNSKDRQEFLSVCHLCDTHPLSIRNSLTIGDWRFEWSVGAYLKIKDNKKNVEILCASQTTCLKYTTWYQVHQVLQNYEKDCSIIFERARKLRRLVTENLHYAPDANEEVLCFIGNFLFHGVPEVTLETSCESVRSTFRAGYCYYFAIMLRAAFQRGKICHAYPFGHIVWLDDNDIPYDVEGVYFGEAEKFVPVELLGDDIEGFKHVNE